MIHSYDHVSGGVFVYYGVAITMALLCLKFDQGATSEEIGPLSKYVASWATPLQSFSSEWAHHFNQPDMPTPQSYVERDDHRELKQQLNDLQLKYDTLRDIKAENARFRSLIRFELRNPELDLLHAEVISRSHLNHVKSLRAELSTHIDDRTLKRIKEGAPIVAQGSLIGRIHHLDLPFIHILTLSDARMSIDVILEESRLKGVAIGDPGAPLSSKIRLDYLERFTKALVGERAISSGVDGLYPAGLVIGEVTKAYVPENGLFQVASLRPSLSIKEIQEVSIILQPPVRPLFPQNSSLSTP